MSSTTQPAAQDGQPKPKRRQPPRGVHPRQCGETAIYAAWEWIYNRRGLTKATWEQIRELAAQGHGPVQVIAWPSAETVYDSRKEKS